MQSNNYIRIFLFTIFHVKATGVLKVNMLFEFIIHENRRLEIWKITQVAMQVYGSDWLKGISLLSNGLKYLQYFEDAQILS